MSQLLRASDPGALTLELLTLEERFVLEMRVESQQNLSLEEE